MRNVYLFQPQYAVEFRQEVNYWLPYSAGCLWSYASQFNHLTDNFKLDGLFFKRDPVAVVLDQIHDPGLVGFSCYVWNEQYCLAIAEHIKQRWPNCVIVFGGTQVSFRTLDHEFIDTIVLGEGEQAFVSILEAVQNNLAVESTYTAARIQNLDIPSPYLTGVFDNIIADNANAIWAMTLETNRGCPYACTFCDWGGVTYSKVKKFGLERVAAELDWASRNKVAYIFCADANFGIMKDRDMEIAKLMRQAADHGSIEAINLQYAKNSTETVFDIAKIIGPYGRGITVSVQSMNQPTLESIKRENLKTNNIQHLMQLSQEYQIGTYTEVILGLPLETTDSWKQGLADLLELGQHQSIDVWFTQLLENSELASNQSRRKYGIKTIWVKDYLNLDQTVDTVPEYTEIVNSTNTMPIQDMIDCYMYAWMILQIHVAGYSQIIARYARQFNGLHYRSFYDQLYTCIQQDALLGPHFLRIKDLVSTYLHTGKLPDGITGGHALHTQSYHFLYQNRLHLIQLCANIINIDKSLEQLQTAFIFDRHKLEPCTVETDFNIFTGIREKTKYQIQTKTSDVVDDLYTIRRKGLLKNLLTV
jgi:radical SAM superfamily enzyme YgiQ (UPF0313 family)